MTPSPEAPRRGLARLPLRLLRKLYQRAFARPSMQGLNEEVLKMVLNARGYDNCCDPEVSGEALFIRRLAARRPVLCIDVGANKGAYAASLLAETGARVISFEPLPKAFASLRSLAERYPGRLTAVNKGVADREGELELHYGTEDSELASFSSEVAGVDYVGAHNVNVMKAAVTTLDAYYRAELAGREERLDLLKIDTEGFEFEVLSGAQELLAALRPDFVQIEYNTHQLFRNHSLLSLSRLLPGYAPYQLLPHGGGLARRDPNSPDANVYRYANFVFVRDGVPV